MNYKKRTRPPLWYVPHLLTAAPGLLMAQKQQNYPKAMRMGLKILGSKAIKQKAFRNYQPTKHDVFVCTYSKSGTYWMMQIVTQIANKGKGESNIFMIGFPGQTSL